MRHNGRPLYHQLPLHDGAESQQVHVRVSSFHTLLSILCIQEAYWVFTFKSCAPIGKSCYRHYEFLQIRIAT